MKHLTLDECNEAILFLQANSMKLASQLRSPSRHHRRKGWRARARFRQQALENAACELQAIQSKLAAALQQEKAA